MRLLPIDIEDGLAADARDLVELVEVVDRAELRVGALDSCGVPRAAGQRRTRSRVVSVSVRPAGRRRSVRARGCGKKRARDRTEAEQKE